MKINHIIKEQNTQPPLMAVSKERWEKAVLARYPTAKFVHQKMLHGAIYAMDQSEQVGIYDPKNSYAKVGPESVKEGAKKWSLPDPNNFDSDNDYYDARDADPNPPEDDWYDDPEPDDIFEADEWEESGDKWKRFQKWSIDQMMRSTERTATGNHVSKLENQYFGHPITYDTSAGQVLQQPFGSVSTNVGAGRRWTEWVKSIMDNYENYEAEWKADSAAALLDNPEYKKFLDRAYADFMGMGQNTTEQREQHAIALSGYQVKHFGGKLFGSLFGNIKGARASMTPEVYGALEKAQYDLEQKKIADWDDERRAEQLKFWQMLPYPVKLLVAAGMGKTPAQVEAILSTSGKSDTEIVGAYMGASNVPGYTSGQQQPQSPPMNQPPRLEGKDKVGNMDADAFDDALARMKKLAGAGPLKTVYDPNKRVYKNVPTAVQPAQQPRKK